MPNINNLKPISQLGPFTKFCCSIGAIPSSYLVSLTYEEQLLWLCNYLQNTVIPTVNNNAEAVTELQNLYTQLHSYVENYFTNLDVQNEINNKLDTMATDGTLEDIINSKIFKDINDNIAKNSTDIAKNSTDIATNSNQINTINNSLNLKNSSLYIHMSFDDVTLCINNLINNSYNSLFDEPFFKHLKSNHDNYGFVYSLYVYNIEQLENVPTKFKNEFFNASNWLKFGLHAHGARDNYQFASYSQAKSDWEFFVTQILRLTGTPNAIDRMPRLANFQGSYGALCAMRNSRYGAMGFLSADDIRSSYSMTPYETQQLNNNLTYFNKFLGLYYIKTNYRIENDENIIAYLTNAWQNNSGFNHYIIFTHEYQIYNGQAITKDFYLHNVGQFAIDNNVPFDFPQNHIFDIRSLPVLNTDTFWGSSFPPSQIHNVVYSPKNIELMFAELIGSHTISSTSKNGLYNLVNPPSHRITSKNILHVNPRNYFNFY